MEEKNQDAPAPKGEAADNGCDRPGPVGLDVGTSRVVVADGTPGQETRSQLNAFVAVPASDMAEKVLRQRGLAYERNCRSLYVYGDDSEFFAAILEAGARRPMCDGLLNPREELGRQATELREWMRTLQKLRAWHADDDPYYVDSYN